MSEPFKQYNMLWRAGWDLKEAWRSGNKAAIKQARNQMIRTSASVVLSSVAAAAAKSLISAMRDDDDEKKEKDESGKTVTVGVRGFGQKYLEAFLPNLLDNATGLLPPGGQLAGELHHRGDVQQQQHGQRAAGFHHADVAGAGQGRL